MMNQERRSRITVSPSVLSLTLGAGLSLLALCGMARAETPDIGIDLSKAEPIFDNQLDSMRGKFVPGNIEGFTLSMSSTVDGDGETRDAGINLGVNIKGGRPQLTIDQTFTSETPSVGGSSSTPGGTASGGNAPLTNLSSGVAQSVQIVGDDNSGLNSATINIASTPPTVPPSPSTGGSPCTTCSVTDNKDGIDVTVDAPGVGNADQMIGAGQITQGITLNANDAAAINSLSLQIQMAPGANNNLAGLGEIVNSVPGFLH
jgi:hypothetical protein